MPNLGHTMEEGEVMEWLKAVGDPVAKGEVIAAIETDKANFDVESPGDGVLLAIDVSAGATVPVGSIIGTVGAPGEAPAGAAPRRASSPSPRPRRGRWRPSLGSICRVSG